MTLYSKKNTSFRNDRLDFSFNTQIITFCIFLDTLFHFSELLFSHLKVELKDNPKLSFRIVIGLKIYYAKCHMCSKCSINDSNILFVSLLSVNSYVCRTAGKTLLRPVLTKEQRWSSLVAQWAKDPELSLLWLWL